MTCLFLEETKPTHTRNHSHYCHTRVSLGAYYPAVYPHVNSQPGYLTLLFFLDIPFVLLLDIRNLAWRICNSIEDEKLSILLRNKKKLIRSRYQPS